MDMYDEVFLDLWRVLKDNEVRYILVGGFAMILYGCEGQPGIIELWIDATVDNRKRLRKAFVESQIGDCEILEKSQLNFELVDFRIGGGIPIEVLTSLKGVTASFDTCLGMASLAEIDGIPIPFLHINHLIENKKVVNRPKDQSDVIELEKIRRILREDQSSSKQG